MRFFIDTEFVEDGKTIELLSVGIVAQDGREFYAETRLAHRAVVHPEKFDPWLAENVIPHLQNDGDNSRTLSKELLAQQIASFVWPSNVLGLGAPEFWGYYADYDWVALCQLYGRMIDLPKGWPMFCLDLKQVAHLGGLKLPKQEGAQHHALADARWIHYAWQHVCGGLR